MSDIKSLEQKRQTALDKANRLQMKIDKKLNRQKFILGTVLMDIVKDDPSRIQQVLSDIDKYVTKEADFSRIEEFKNDLLSKIEEAPIKHNLVGFGGGFSSSGDTMELFKERVRAIRSDQSPIIACEEDGPIDDDIPF